MEKITLNIEERGQCGSGACGRLRKESIIPAVVYGPSGAQNVQVRKADFRKMMLEKGERAALIELHCGSTTKLSLLQASQRNPRTDEYLHIDFKEVDPNKPMVAKVPLKFVGDPIGVKDEGGVLDIARRAVNITCLPKHLPEFIEVNIADLHLEQTIHVRNLPKLEGVEYKTSAGEVVASCVNTEEETGEAATAETGTASATATAPAAEKTEAKAQAEKK